ncbi:MAG TPA: hypothetical protein VK386_00330 [Acidimicrobiales bacterium]|nr:hypothetical protein [Acidimicrobiales bacterium]
MPTATTAGGGKAPAAAPITFLQGSWEYSEWMAQDSLTLGNQTEFVHNITPGGFLRGVTFSITSSGGTLGTTATIASDAPFSIIYSMTLESIDGTPILYPMYGYDYYLVSRWARQWDGDPVNDLGQSGSSYQNTINPQFRLRFFAESRMTIGVLPNTDARAQYRLRYTIAPLVQPSNTNYGLVSSSTGVTAPTTVINLYLETYAQPPATDYSGNPIAQVPDGIALQRFVSHQAGDPQNTGVMDDKMNRVGNLIRLLIWINRTSAAARVELSSDPIRLRLDNTQLWMQYRDRIDYEMGRWGKQAAASTYNSNRPTGVYAYNRYHNPGAMDGPYWLPTTEASYLQVETNGGQSSGTWETITEDLAPAGPVPAYLQGL